MNIRRWIVQLPLVLLVVTLSFLGLHIFGGRLPFANQQTGMQGVNGSYRLVADVALGKVEVASYKRMGFTHGFLQFSPDGVMLAMGSETGEIRMMEATGRLLWTQQLGLGKVSAVHFSSDSGSLVIGETSQQGSLLGWDVQTGRELWRYSSAAQLGVDVRRKTYPGFVGIAADGSGNIYAVGQRYVKHADGRSQYFSRIYRFSSDGRLLAMFPPDNNLDAWVSWISVDDAGAKLVFGTANWDVDGAEQYTDTVYCLDGSLSDALWSRHIAPMPPYQNTTMRSSPDISPDGRYVAGIASDGRSFLFNSEGGQLLWQRSVSRPREIGGVSINAVGSNVQYTDYGIVVTTGNTYNKANWQLPTPVEHPGSNSVFVFDQQGGLISRYRTGGMIEQFAVSGNRIVLAVGRNTKTQDPSVHGMYILSLPQLDVVDFFPMNGPCVGVAAARDGRLIAGVEAPLQLSDGQVTGTYRLVVLEQPAN